MYKPICLDKVKYEARLEQEENMIRRTARYATFREENDKLMPLAAYDTGKDVLNFPETRADLLKLPGKHRS